MPISVLPQIAQLKKYTPPWAGIDRGEYIRLDLNECTSPLPPHAVDACHRFAESTKTQRYPCYDELMPSLADYAGVSTDQLMVTNGSDQAIEVVLRSFLERGGRLLIAVPEFPMFRQGCSVLSANMVEVPFQADLSFPCDEYASALVNEEGKVDLAVIVNPNNPTGTPVKRAYIQELLAAHPDTPFLVDEAYFEYTRETVADLIPAYANLIVARTFSKAFAMAGLRLGYVLAQRELIEEFEKVRGPFDVNALAVEVAVAHLQHSAWCSTRVAEVSESKSRTEDFLNQQGMRFFRGAANFLLVEHPRRDQLVEHLFNDGILVRPMTAPAIDGTLRMSIGTQEEMAKFMHSIERFNAAAEATPAEQPL